MAFERAVDLYLNTRLTPGLILLKSKTDPSPPPALQWIQGDRFLLRLWFLEPSATIGQPPAVQSVPAGSTLKFAGKASPGDPSLLFLAPSFTEVGAGDDLHYEATLDLNTVELENAFQAANTITATCDVEVRDAGNTERITFQFTVTVHEQIYRGDESDPVPASPPYPAAGDLYTKAEVDALLAGLGVRGLGAVTATLGGGPTDLDGQPCGNSGMAVGTIVLLGDGTRWLVQAGTQPSDPAAGYVRGSNYAAGSNEYVFVRIG